MDIINLIKSGRDGVREAMLWEPADEGKVRCHLCAHRCLVADEKAGICRVRYNLGGTLYTLVYANCASRAIDPIEKKPLFHFHPGSPILSIATVGCNFQCAFCQNWSLSQMPRDLGKVEGRLFPPAEVVAAAQKSGCKSIAFTYSEPTIFFEYCHETALLADRKGIKSVFVTNGYMTREALEAIHPHLHAANVDLKAFSEETYQRVMKARLEPVKESIRAMHDLGIWVEITTLVVPGMNDSDAELRRIAEFIVSVGPEIPWHISRYHPDYKDRGAAPTPIAALRRAHQIGKDAGLRYVYTGNVPGDDFESTFCYRCRSLVIERYGFTLGEYRLQKNHCPECNTMIDGVGLDQPVKDWGGQRLGL